MRNAGSICLLWMMLVSAAADVSQTQQQPAMVRNGQPGAMHRRLDALVGGWNVDMTFYIAGG
jgi:hypothetical protein